MTTTAMTADNRAEIFAAEWQRKAADEVASHLPAWPVGKRRPAWIKLRMGDIHVRAAAYKNVFGKALARLRDP